MNFSNLHSEDLGNLIYLSLLLAMLASGILFRKSIRLSVVIKQLGIWTIIALIMVLIYSYRFDFKDRIKGELMPSKAREVGEGQISVYASKDGHFYMDVFVNEKPVRFMIDTGASDITLSLADAKNIGINLESLKFNKAYSTANGKIFGANTNLDKMQVADLIIRDIGASVNNSDMETSLLGMSFLRKFKKYEFHRNVLTLSY